MKMKLITGNVKKMIRMLSFIIVLPVVQQVQASENFTVNVLGPLSVAAKVASPIVNAYAPPQASFIYNTVNLLSSGVNLAASNFMADQSHGYAPSTTQMVTVGSLLRNTAETVAAFTAAAFSYAYWSTGNDTYNTVAVTLSAVNAVSSIIGTSLMYGISYPEWMTRKKK